MHLFYNLKKILNIILFLFLYQSALAVNDSLSLRIYPNEIKGDSIPEKIYCTIKNNTSSTYLTPFDLYLKPIGLKPPHLYAWPYYTWYSANLLFLFKDSVRSTSGDGVYHVFFCKFPKLFVIPPYSEKTFIINLKSFDILNIKARWELYGRIALANKDSLESLINKFYPDRYNEYYASIISSDLIPINVTDSLWSLSNCIPEVNWNNYENLPPYNLEKIKDAFEIVLWSYRSYH